MPTPLVVHSPKPAEAGQFQVAILDENGNVIAFNDSTRLKTPVSSPTIWHNIRFGGSRCRMVRLCWFPISFSMMRKTQSTSFEMTAMVRDADPTWLNEELDERRDAETLEEKNGGRERRSECIAI